MSLPGAGRLGLAIGLIGVGIFPTDRFGFVPGSLLGFNFPGRRTGLLGFKIGFLKLGFWKLGLAGWKFGILVVTAGRRNELPDLIGRIPAECESGRDKLGLLGSDEIDGREIGAFLTGTTVPRPVRLKLLGDLNPPRWTDGDFEKTPFGKPFEKFGPFAGKLVLAISMANKVRILVERFISLAHF